MDFAFSSPAIASRYAQMHPRVTNSACVVIFFSNFSIIGKRRIAIPSAGEQLAFLYI